MKYKFIFVVAAILCLIPSAVAYASYHRIQNAPVDVGNAVSISIDDPAGNNFSYTKERDGDEADDLIRYFLQLKDRAQPITDLPDALQGEQFFKVTISAAVKKAVTYECYYTTDPATCYFKTQDGTPYKISDEDAEAFITTKYAESIYKAASMPTLTLSGTVDVTPDEAAWLYRNYTGGYVESDVSSLVYPSVESYEVDGSLKLAFDMNPDFCSVKVSNTSGDVLFDGMLDALSELSLRNVPQIYVEVTAKWYEDASRSFYGNLLYSFSSFVNAPAEFWLGTGAIKAGRFVAITATNVKNPETITMTSTMPNADSPVFYAAGESMAVALLGVDIDVPAGTYDLAFNYGTSTAHVALNVLDPNDGAGIQSSDIYLDESFVQQTRSSAALMQYESAEQEILSKSSATRYFYGNFLDGVAGDRILQRGFGRDIYLNDSATPLYRNNGVDYTADEGTQIMACNDGEVVYVGWLDYTGNMIVIDHGWGLKTWYCNLGSSYVSVGDIVTKGQGIGTVGRTGFTAAMGAHICMSVGNKFVCPYDTWSDSLTAGKVLIAKIDE